MRQALAYLALAAVFIAGCSAVAPNSDGLDGPATTIAISTGSDGLEPLGVPFDEGVSIVESIEVAIYALDASDSPVALRFRFADGIYSYDPDGPLTTIDFPFQGTVDVALPAGNDYGFEASGADGVGTWLAYGLTTAHVDVTTTTVRLALETMIDVATLDTTSLTSAVVPGQAIDLHLAVDAPGGYKAPVSDYAVTYAILPDDGTIGAISKVGTRAVATASPTDDTFTLTATITGWRDVAGVATMGDVTATFEAPYAVASGMGFDTTAPVVAFDATVEPAYAGSVYALSGTASDDTGVDRVQLFDGPVLVGSTDPLEHDVEGVSPIALLGGSWTADWTPSEARSHTLTALAIDTAGNEQRVDAIVEVGEPLSPEVALETLTNWWATTPVDELRSFGSIRIQVTFRYEGPDSVTFSGDGGGADPAGELQFWTNPGLAAPPAVFHAFPQGSYAFGDTLTWDVSFDVSALDAADTGIAIRPAPTGFGTVGPDTIFIMTESVTLGD